MNTRTIILAFFLFTFLTAKSQVEIKISQPIDNNFVESELISDVSFIPLQYEKVGTISPDMELRIDGDDIFILDNRQTQNVYRFNSSGELTDTITTQKRTTDSNLPVLNNPVKFSINPNLKQLEIFTFENLALNRFSYTGKKIDKITFPISPSDFIRDQSGNYWLYSGWNSKESQYRLIHTDKNGKVLDRSMRLVTKCTPIESYALSSYKNQIFLYELLGNVTYKIENNNIKETFFFNYGQKNLPPAFHSMEPYDSYVMINRTGYFSIKKYLENAHFAYFFLNFTTETGKEIYHVIYDKDNKTTYRYFENAGIAAFDKAQALTDDNELIFLVAPRKIRQLTSSETDMPSPSFDGLVDASKEYRNTMVVKVKLGTPEESFQPEE